MLETAWKREQKEGASSGWRYDFALRAQRVFVAVGPDESSAHKKQLVEDFLQSHFSSLEKMDSEDVELLILKLSELLGEQEIAVVVLFGNSVVYAITGARVFIKRGSKQGYIASGEKKLTLFQAFFSVGDAIHFSVGNGSLTLFITCQADSDSLLFKKEPINKKSLFHVWKDFIAQRKSQQPQLYLKNDERKKFGGIALVLFLILLVSVGLGWKKRQLQMRETAFNALYEPALHLLVQAEGVYKSDPLPAREMLLEAQTKLKSALESYPKESSEGEKLTTLNSKVSELYAVVSGEKSIQKPEVFFDLNLVREGMSAQKIAFGDEWLVALDVQKGILVGIDTSTKNGKVLSGGELLSGASLVSASTGKAMVLAQKGLIGIYFGDRTPELLVPRDSLWENPKALGMFGGSVYLADAQTNEIWLYPGFDGGLGERKRWFGPGITPNLSQISALVVDGDIWVGMSDGAITHYRRGAPLNVRLTGLSTPLSEVTSIVALYEDENLYVFDRPNGRVVKFGKDGVYKNQFMSEELSKASDMTIMRIEGNRDVILFSSGSTIYQIPIE